MAGPPRIVFKDSPSSMPMPTIVFRNKDDTLTDAAALVRSAAFSIALPTPQTMYSSVRKTQGSAPGSAPQLSFSELATSCDDLTPEQAHALAAEQARMTLPRQITVSLGRSLPQETQAASAEAYQASPSSALPDMYGRSPTAQPEHLHTALPQHPAPSQQEQQQYLAHLQSIQDLAQHQLHTQPDPLAAHDLAQAMLQRQAEPAGIRDSPEPGRAVSGSC